jgi:hypothetical protein
MRTVSYLLAILLASAVVYGQDNLFTPMKGSATPEFQMSNDNGRCLVFGTNIVKSVWAEEGGETVSIWRRSGTSKGAAACRLGSTPYAEIKDFDNNAFYGISANYFFIDTGTSAGSRTLYVYKTGSGEDVTNVNYFAGETSPRIEAARYLYYDTVSNKKGPASSCKEASKWKRQGGSVAWLQSKKMDLDEQTVTNVGPLHCAYQE